MQIVDETLTTLPVQMPLKTFRYREQIVVNKTGYGVIPYAHPIDDEYSYDNYLTGIKGDPEWTACFNSYFSDGSKGKLSKPHGPKDKLISLENPLSQIKNILTVH